MDFNRLSKERIMLVPDWDEFVLMRDALSLALEEIKRGHWLQARGEEERLTLFVREAEQYAPTSRKRAVPTIGAHISQAKRISLYVVATPVAEIALARTMSQEILDATEGINRLTQAAIGAAIEIDPNHR